MFRYLEAITSMVALVRLKFTVVWVTALVTLNSLVTQQRISHEKGFVLHGRLRMVDDPTYPRNEFFTAATSTPVGHASVLRRGKTTPRW